jgi:hypothetical protein
VLSTIDLTNTVFPSPKLPVTDVAVITAATDKYPVPLIPSILNVHDVVDVAVTEAIVVSGIISPVA